MSATVVCVFQVPSGQPKKELLDDVDKVPTFVQQLQFAVKNVTVGKAATFTKVDNVIQEVKNLMAVINKVTQSCMNCANKVCTSGQKKISMFITRISLDFVTLQTQTLRKLPSSIFADC